jgi:hypothetical protein
MREQGSLNGFRFDLAMRSAPQNFAIAHDENLRRLVRDSGSRLNFIRHAARLLHRYQTNRMLNPGHLCMCPSADPARITMFEDYGRRTVRLRQEPVQRIHIRKVDEAGRGGGALLIHNHFILADRARF